MKIIKDAEAMNGIVLYKVVDAQEMICQSEKNAGKEIMKVVVSLIDKDGNKNIGNVCDFILADMGWKFKQLFESAGELEKFKKLEEVTPFDLIAFTGYAEVETSETNKGPRLNIKKWLKPGDFVIPDGLTRDRLNELEPGTVPEKEDPFSELSCDEDIPF